MFVVARNVAILTLCWMGLQSHCFARYENPRFSPDERQLVFDHCEDRCRFVIYSLNERTANAFEKPRDEDWINPSFAPSSDTLVFVTRRTRLDGQIAMVRVDGTGFKILTASNTIKRSPSFAPDGRSIAFVGAELREGDQRGAGLQDVYLIDLATSVEQRITDLRVQRISAPFFRPDGERFVISTIGAGFPRSRPLWLAH